MSRWKHGIKRGFDMAVPRYTLDGMHVNFLIDNSLNVGSVAADQSIGLLGHLMLWECIQNAFTIISNTNGIFVKVRQSLIRRTEACILAEGGIFEHFLQLSQ